ncbi:hypothetical protein BC941DRAFT_420967 [Chlamydoabsidia padenii]|nr:hypothetical protein BC941DRAFT_420967 [Chlamydoabsidia padenii]
MDPEYDPSHKTSSITSTTSTNSWDTVPSLTASSVCDLEDSPSLNDTTTFDEYSFTGGDQLGLTVPYDKEYPNNNNNKIVSGGNNDQKSFTHFLDNFFVDGEPTVDKTSIGTPIFLHHSHEINIPHSSATENNNATPTTKPSLFTFLEPKLEQEDNDASTRVTDNKDDQQQQQQRRMSRDLLTEDEKRANHIASEQKRRNTIRTGFKEMTEIIPTLKNFNNSKSTVLFKAVDYIRHLEKRNRGLRDKLNSLQVRLEVEGRMGGLIRGSQHLLRRHSHYYNDHQHKRSRSHSLQQQQQQQLPPEAFAALLAHKNQQKQLEALQEQLRYQQELLAKHNITVDSNRISSRTNHHRHLSIDERSSPLYYSISIPTDQTTTTTTASSTSSSTTTTSSSSSSSSLSQRRSSVYNHSITDYSNQRNQHHRSSAPALVMPNMIDESWHPHSSTNASPLGAPSFTIPADDDFHHRPMTPSSPPV